MTVAQAMEMAITRAAWSASRYGRPDRIRRLLTEPDPAERHLPGRLIMNLPAEAREALLGLTSDAICLQPRNDLVGD